jgi:PleD family two-component response regulator
VVTALCYQKGSPARLIEQADQQLYEAKAMGRNQVISTILLDQ